MSQDDIRARLARVQVINGTLATTRKGVLKLPLALPAQDFLEHPDDVGSVLRGEWKIVPLLMFVGRDESQAQPEASLAAGSSTEAPEAKAAT